MRERKKERSWLLALGSLSTIWLADMVSADYTSEKKEGECLRIFIIGITFFACNDEHK